MRAKESKIGHFGQYKYKMKAELSQRWPRDAPYTWVPWKIFGSPWLRPRLLYPRFV